MVVEGALKKYIESQLRRIRTALRAGGSSFDDEFDRVLEAQIVAQIIRKHRKLHTRNPESGRPRWWRVHNRHVDKIARSLIRAAKGYPRHNYSSRATRHEGVSIDVLTARQKASLLLGSLRADRHSSWRPIGQRLRNRVHRTISIQDFSFFDDPNRVMASLAEIAVAECVCLNANIHFLDLQCKDLGAWLVLAAMMPDMAPVFDGGAIGPGLAKVLSALQFTDYMQISFRSGMSDHEDIWAFPLTARRAAGKTDSEQPMLDPQDSEKVGDRLADAFDKWLTEAADQQLSHDGRRLVKVIVGETLDNAQRYGRPEFPDDGDWMISGFMARVDEGGERFLRCHLAFFNVGSSLDSTIQDCASEIAELRDQYVLRHKTSLGKLKYPEEHLRTIFCLQDGVTCDRAAARDRRGGTGLGDIIFLFSDLAGIISEGSDARMAIVSGKTCLHVGWPYCRSGSKVFAGNRAIWFNAENDPERPPDQRCVFDLECELPGTLITMAFRLDRDYLEKSVDGSG